MLHWGSMVRRASGVVVLAALGAFGCSSRGAPGDSKAEGIGIIGGNADTTSNAVFAIQNDAGGLCTGSLIAPNLILTAQHCVAELSEPDAPVMCGDTEFSRVYPASAFLVTWDADITNGAPNASIHQVNLVVTPPSRSLCGNDIALLRLSDNVPATQAVPIVPRVDSRPTTEELFDAIGYGIQDPDDDQGQTAGERMRANDNLVGCVGAFECNGTGATGTEWAAEAPICSGDSGGPALDAQGRVIGVASRGDPDCTIGIYSAIDSWRTLIIDTAIDAADDGGYDPPSWTGAAPMDGGAPDAGGTTDAGATMDAGNPVVDAGGTMDAGMNPPDAATPMDAGMSPPDAGTPPADSGTPVVDSGVTPVPDAGGGGLGAACNNACDPGYQCWSAQSEPPGICVPPCDSTLDCPDGYRCTASLGVCTPRPNEDDDETVTKTSAGCSCRTAPHAPGAPWATFATLLGVIALGARRRRSTKTRLIVPDARSAEHVTPCVGRAWVRLAPPCASRAFSSSSRSPRSSRRSR